MQQVSAAVMLVVQGLYIYRYLFRLFKTALRLFLFDPSVLFLNVFVDKKLWMEPRLKLFFAQPVHFVNPFISLSQN